MGGRAVVVGCASVHCWHYRRYLRSDHWRATRLDAVRRAGFRCERCGVGGALALEGKVRHLEALVHRLVNASEGLE
jgi:hypothetical protein